MARDSSDPARLPIDLPGDDVGWHPGRSRRQGRRAIDLGRTDEHLDPVEPDQLVEQATGKAGGQQLAILAAAERLERLNHHREAVKQVGDFFHRAFLSSLLVVMSSYSPSQSSIGPFGSGTRNHFSNIR